MDSLKADERRLEAFHMNCQRQILGMRWFHFVTNASVTSQTGEEGLAIRICRRRLSIFGSRAEATPAHSALRLAVDARAGGKPDIRPEWKRQRGWPCRTWVQQIEDDTGLNANDAWRSEDRTWPQVLEGATTRGQSSVPLTDWLTDWLISTTVEAGNFKFGTLGLGLAYQKTTFWDKNWRGSGQREHPNKIWDPLLISATVSATSNLVHNLGLGLAYQQQRLGPKLAEVWARGATEKIWDPIFISATVEEKDYWKIGTRYEFRFTLPNTSFRTKL